MSDWSQQFDDPIPLEDGRQLRTLRDAGEFIQQLPKSEQEKPHWQLAAEILIAVVEGREMMREQKITLVRWRQCHPHKSG